MGILVPLGWEHLNYVISFHILISPQPSHPPHPPPPFPQEGLFTNMRCTRLGFTSAPSIINCARLLTSEEGRWVERSETQPTRKY